LGDFRIKNSTPAASSAAGSGVVTSSGQFDGAFIDKIVELSKQGDGLVFEQELLKQKLDFENANVDISDRRSRMLERLQFMNGGLLAGDIRTALEKKFVLGLEQTVSDLNQLWKDSSAFMADLNNKRLNFDKSLYRLSEIPLTLRMEKSTLFGPRFFASLVVAVLLGAIVGIGAFAIKRIVSYGSREKFV
jgi:hypothetical protein